jgi:hypothetical protein
MTMSLIQTATVGTAGAASISFTSIPGNGTDLFLQISTRTNGTAGVTSTPVGLTFNSTTTGYTYRTIFGEGSAGVNGDSGSTRFGYQAPKNINTPNTFDNSGIYIPNYAGSQNKNYASDSSVEQNATTGYLLLLAGLWSVTDAITSITVADTAAANFLPNSTISLYKITKGSDGIVTASTA